MANRVAKYGKYAKRFPAVQKRYRVYAPAMRQLASDVMYLKGLVNSEPQVLTVQASNNVSWAGLNVSLSDVAQGDGYGQRSGDRILPRYLSINLSMGAASGFAGRSFSARYMVYRYWGEDANAAPLITPGDILQTVGSQYAPLSHLNSNIVGSKGDRNRRIEVLRSEICTFDLVGNGTKFIPLNIEMNGKSAQRKEHIEYPGAAVGPISGGIYILLVGGTAVAGDFFFQLESRMTFYDN